MLAYNIAALILFILANAFPLLTLRVQGVSSTATLIEASHALYLDGHVLLALVVFINTVLGPAAVILATCYVVVAARWLPRLALARWLLSRIGPINPWAMLDVFMLGILVSVVKLRDVAEVIIGPALYAFVVLIFVATAATAAFEPQLVWARLDRRHG